MTRALGASDVEDAALGGMVLGGGGGGHLEDGRRLGATALASGAVQLTDPGELDPTSLVVVCAGVGAPGAPDQHVTPEDYLTAFGHLADQVAKLRLGTIAAVATNENGAMATLNGWLQAARLDLPLVDCPCNGRAHPTAVMGSLGLHLDPEYKAIAGFAGGGPRHLEGVVVGGLTTTARIVREASVLAGGMVAVARNPVSVGYLTRHGAPGGISQALEVGQALRSGGVGAVAALLSGEVVASGPVHEFEIAQLGGYDAGRFGVDCVDITFANEYMSAAREGEVLAEFPDLIMTFDIDGAPIVSADLESGMYVAVMVAPRSSLKLSTTMDMPDLMQPVHALLRGEAPGAG